MMHITKVVDEWRVQIQYPINLFYVAAIKTPRCKENLGEKGLFDLYFPVIDKIILSTMFIVASFIIARNLKQLRCSSTEV